MKLYILFLALVFCSCNSTSTGTFVISDFIKDTLISPETKTKNSMTLWLYIKGSANDTIIVNGVKWKVNSDKIDSLQLDYFSQKLSIKFEPYKAQKEKLRLNTNYSKEENESLNLHVLGFFH
ncbi:hypothetical protein KO02_13525 [Sphingobacterium sp. ML3W]|uniref:hypothetical protein n=1 Tax=Sphingobacterium sp. ML3W TaxID=1538644 RepID=UPI0004F6B047|nr:hypothetical protein [Sphingobacterium sp. ML3W]AIM37591.1 hypothetical protein KO02_13525 [Sphingobacterium sp. ML3W]